MRTRIIRQYAWRIANAARYVGAPSNARTNTLSPDAYVCMGERSEEDGLEGG